MSFSTEQKAHISEQPAKSLCCKRAFVSGILTSSAALNEDGLAVSVSTREIANQVSAAVREAYSKECEITTIPTGGRGYLVKFRSPAAERAMRAFLDGGDFLTSECPNCQSPFLRGVFLAAGRMTDPIKQYMLEFSVKGATERFVSLFEELGLSPRVSEKTNERVIYFRNSSAIEDFFTLAGMNTTTFALINAKIQREIRNNVNRVANCETSNINKAVAASAGQLAVIKRLIETGLISRLPDELRKTAILRVEHSDLSLSQLAALMTPYISKPGLSHRLKKITEIGEELLKSSKRKV